MEFRKIKKVISAFQIPEVLLEEGIRVKVISGHLANVRGPMDENTTNMEYIEVTLPGETSWQHRIPSDHTGFLHIITGDVSIGETKLEEQQLGFYGPGDHIVFTSGPAGGKFLLISSRAVRQE
jgi:quercetin 2,3-dioxygenase